MDYEKKYKDALERAREFYILCKKCGAKDTVNFLEDTFPELKESEDERIMKAIHIYLDWLDGRKDYAPRGEYTIRDMIAWLEKQGEPTDINPSEFDLRLNKLLKQFETLSKEELASSLSFYLNVVQNDGTYKAEEKQGEQPRYSIGDVLCDKSCTTLNKDAQPNFEITDIRNGMYICDKCSFPISQQDEYELVAKKMEQKPAEWSEEDEKHLQSIISTLTIPDKKRYMLTFGLNSLYKRQSQIRWLNSLRPQNRWKPTKEQMEALHDLNLTGNISYAGQGQVLIELYNDLKKLTE